MCDGINTSGRGKMRSIQDSRINKTRSFFEDKQGFLCNLVKEIESACKRAEKKGLRPCFRLNLTSDLPWENIRCNDGQNIFEKFPQVQFYDYTKGFKRMEKYLNGVERVKSQRGQGGDFTPMKISFNLFAE